MTTDQLSDEVRAKKGPIVFAFTLILIVGIIAVISFPGLTAWAM